eukprot:m.332716 g.332716  ORF g.332716 m.332716 type:complete len:370 (+) comp55641_c0_seq3:1114-2223(+)
MRDFWRVGQRAVFDDASSAQSHDGCSCISVSATATQPFQRAAIIDRFEFVSLLPAISSSADYLSLADSLFSCRFPADACHSVQIFCHAIVVAAALRVRNVAFRLSSSPAQRAVSVSSSVSDPTSSGTEQASATTESSSGLFLVGRATALLEDCDFQMSLTALAQSSLTLLHSSVRHSGPVGVAFLSSRTCRVLFSCIRGAEMGLLFSSRRPSTDARIVLVHSKITECDKGLVISGFARGILAYSELSRHQRVALVMPATCRRSLRCAGLLFSGNDRGVLVSSVSPHPRPDGTQDGALQGKSQAWGDEVSEDRSALVDLLFSPVSSAQSDLSNLSDESDDDEDEEGSGQGASTDENQISDPDDAFLPEPE